MTSIPRKSRFQFSLKTLMLLITLAAVGFAVWRPLAVAYNLRMLDRTWQAENIDSHASHVEAFVRLGHYEERRFAFNHLVAGSPESRTLLASLRSFAGNLPSDESPVSMVSGYSPGQAHAITIWARPDQMSQLSSIVEAHDVPSQQAR
jgi:hypothetical protein